MDTIGEQLSTLLLFAWLLPLLGFAVEIFGGYWSDRLSKAAAYLAVGCIGMGFVLSSVAIYKWGEHTHWQVFAAHEDEGHHDDAEDGNENARDGEHEHDHHGDEEEEEHVETVFSGTFYTLAVFGDVEFSIDYYIDSLTLVMFAMVTFIATWIHVFAIGYMSDELTDDYVDHEVHLPGGKHFHRPGRFYKFFAFMSLFSFSMLGVVISGNIFQVFVFWELVGICSYLLIGFYVERKSASTAANKAFIVNRVGDFGFIIGLMIIVTSFGTFRFGDYDVEVDGETEQRPGLFTMVRGEEGHLEVAEEEGEKTVLLHGVDGGHAVDSETGEHKTIPYMLLVVAGLGIFAGCVGKSAQFPLQTWLPDAMEGPTPVSALVHSSTMVAAGVYLAGRFFPVFTPEVLLTIAYVGCITLFIAATIAIVATDIKRVLAYSTISQLGYMMLAIGVAGWAAGLFHLVTHAFFKSLMFLASGSVIIGCHHEQEMPKMGGLRKKMPVTAYTMLVGVIAICGLAIPGTAIAFSGYHSKDAILATSLAYTRINDVHFLLFIVPLVTAGITAFYMFRLWFYTFAGQPRDEHIYDHAKESPLVMTAPLVILALFAAGCAIGGEGGWLFRGIQGSQPAGLEHGAEAASGAIGLPGHEQIHAAHGTAGTYALIAAVAGTLLAYLFYGIRLVSPAEIKRQFVGCYTFLVEKWRFDDLYDAMLVQPAHVVASWAAWIDKNIIDWFLHACCHVSVWLSRWDRIFDERVIDRIVNLLGDVTFGIGRSLRVVQTGRLRQYVMFIAIGVVALFVVLFAFFPRA